MNDVYWQVPVAGEMPVSASQKIGAYFTGYYCNGHSPIASSIVACSSMVRARAATIAYSTETGHSVHGKVDSRSVATRGLFFTPDLWV